MWLPLKAVMLAKPRKDGNFLIYFQYCFNSTKRVLLSTEMAIPSSYWNKKREFITNSLPKEYGEPNILNEELTKMRKIIEGIIQYAEKSECVDTCHFVKLTFTPLFKIDSLNLTESPNIPVKRKEPDFFQELESYKKSKGKQLASVKTIVCLIERLKQFQTFTKNRVSFSTLDYNFYMEFVDFLTYDYLLKRKKKPEYGLKLSTIGSTIKNLRVFVNDRKKRKIIHSMDLSDFKLLDEECDAIYLCRNRDAWIPTNWH
jgi:hypothetical protein